MPDPGDGYLERNATGLVRLSDVAGRLGEVRGRLHLPGGWTGAAVLAHLAFWDRFVIARWEGYDRDGSIIELPSAHMDLVNAAELPMWRSLDLDAAAAQAMAAASQVLERIRSLSPEALTYARMTRRPAMLDRTLHWSPHLDELAEALIAP
jgi:hypothetical protein